MAPRRADLYLTNKKHLIFKSKTAVLIETLTLTTRKILRTSSTGQKMNVPPGIMSSFWLDTAMASSPITTSHIHNNRRSPI